VAAVSATALIPSETTAIVIELANKYFVFIPCYFVFLTLFELSQ
jgi:hypothetical protein